jgi:hypothetical protein
MSAFPKPLLRLAFPFCSCPECSPLSPNYNSLSKRARDRFEEDHRELHLLIESKRRNFASRIHFTR